MCLSHEGNVESLIRESFTPSQHALAVVPQTFVKSQTSQSGIRLSHLREEMEALPAIVTF